MFGLNPIDKFIMEAFDTYYESLKNGLSKKDARKKILIKWLPGASDGKMNELLKIIDNEGKFVENPDMEKIKQTILQLLIIKFGLLTTLDVANAVERINKLHKRKYKQYL